MTTEYDPAEGYDGGSGGFALDTPAEILERAYQLGYPRTWR